MPGSLSPSRSTLEHARSLDAQDPLRHLRDEFIIPSRADVKRRKVARDKAIDGDREEVTPCTYLCGNSLGLQPKRVRSYVDRYLGVWATKGVFGHFKPLDDQLTSPWLDIGDDPQGPLSKIVGARKDEVAAMGTLTANLHFLMASFYRPTKERWKIILERKAFPSDHYAVKSQIQHHDLSPADAMVFLEPIEAERHYLPTSHILKTIDEHASTAALLLLPGVQFYSGQFFDIERITRHAHDKGIVVGWDLAHAVGNVPLQLHDWDVDFAAWCHYKYMNAGPGAIAGLFVHERHGSIVDPDNEGDVKRLSGWWGSDQSSRFRMENRFVPIPGAGGWQLSNPSAIDTTALMASLSVFEETSMQELREKSLKITAYLEGLLDELGKTVGGFNILTSSDETERGAQLSVALADGLLEPVLECLEQESVVVDERKPNVIRVAPAPLYNSYEDAWTFVQIFGQALKSADEGRRSGQGSVMLEGGRENHAWSEIKWHDSCKTTS